MRRSGVVWMPLFMGMSCLPIWAQEAPEARFIQWARAAQVPVSFDERGVDTDDLETLLDWIGDARVVALSDFAHMGAEPTRFRNRLFRFLVEEAGFAAIAVESGHLEGRAAQAYVAGGPESLESVVANTFSYGFHADPMNADLLAWMRNRNADREADGVAVRFYGFDASGRANPRDGLAFPVRAALDFLDVVDPAQAADLRGRLSEFLPLLKEGDFMGGPFVDLPAEDLDRMTAAIADLVSVIEQGEGPYTEARGPVEYRWASRAAVGARDADALVRDAVHDIVEDTLFSAPADQVRERIMSDNLRWILDQEEPRGRVLVYASINHISAGSLRLGYSADVARRFAAVGLRESVSPTVYPAGSSLRRRFDDDYLVIGVVVGDGIRSGCGGRYIEVPPAPIGTFAEIARRASDGTSYMLDLRRAPEDVAKWLADVHRLDDGAPHVLVAPAAAMDLLLYVPMVGPACA